MDLQLKNRVAFVAGSSRGIGRAIVIALLREQCRVCITGRDHNALAKTGVELREEFGDRVVEFSGDLTDPIVADQALAFAHRQWGDLDILIANLGTGRGKIGWRQDESDWEHLFRANFFGSVRLAQCAIPYLENRGGSILFVSSITAIEATSAPLPYSAAKAALVNYSKNLSRLVCDLGIRVNCIAPGNVLFPGSSWETHLQNRRSEVEHYISSEVPQKRFGSPDEIASFAAYLVSPISGFATGGCYVMDGGQTRGI
jgi:3-oxoacyl-[acyl-carrier protein] reductase